VARIYTNENFPQQAVEHLRFLGQDVETSHDAGNSGRAMSDEAVLDYAIRHQRVVVTLTTEDDERIGKCGVVASFP